MCSPSLTFSPKTTIFPSFKEWEQKQSKFELDLGFAVLKIPNFDNILLGVEVSSACFEAESPEPSCQMVKSDNFFEACELWNSVMRFSMRQLYIAKRSLEMWVKGVLEMWDSRKNTSIEGSVDSNHGLMIPYWGRYVKSSCYVQISCWTESLLDWH